MSLALGIALLTGAFCPAGEARQQIAFEDVIVNLKASAPSNRVQALKMLRESGYLEAALPVVPLMADTAKDVQFDAIDTEVSLFLVDEAYTREVGRAIVGKGDASLALLAFAEGPGATVANPVPSAVITGLVGATKSPFLEVRFEATYALGVLGPPLVRTGAFREARAAVDRLIEDLAASRGDPTFGLTLARAAVVRNLGLFGHMVWLSGTVRSPFVDRVRRAVAAALDGEPSLERIAKDLGLSVRTLRRHLVQDGTSLRAVLDDVRRERADTLLARGASVKEVAFDLGFSEPSAFSRAYKRWTGKAPGFGQSGH